MARARAKAVCERPWSSPQCQSCERRRVEISLEELVGAAAAAAKMPWIARLPRVAPSLHPQAFELAGCLAGCLVSTRTRPKLWQ